MYDSDYSSAPTADECSRIEVPKIPTKRRSIIFQRRSINQHITANVSQFNDPLSINSEQSTSTKSPAREDETFNLSDYITSLNNERQSWRKKLNELKSQRRYYVKQETNLGDKVDVDYSVLTETERLFLQSRPNYAEISRNIKNLLPIAVKVAQLNIHINNLHKSLSNCVEEKIFNATKQVTKLADA